MTINDGTPELMDLPVYREDFISQERVDELCKMISWPSGLAELHEGGVRFEITYYYIIGEAYGNAFDDPCNFFRAKEAAGEIEKISYIAMVDLLYEIDRRVRIGLGFEDYLPVGHPRVPSTDGKCPALDSPYYDALKKEGTFKIHRFYKDGPLYAAKNNKAFNKLCKETPEVLFASTEAIRRDLTYWELYSLIGDSLQEKSTNT